MQSYKSYSLTKYLNQLAARKPVPGGGSAAALVASLGAALISMVANYSKGRSRSKKIEGQIKNTLRKSEKIRNRLERLVDLDAQAYLRLTKVRGTNTKIKKASLKKAREVPLEVCRLCYEAVRLTPFLVKRGSPYLISDIQVAAELLLAAFNASLINVKVNK